MDLVAEIDSFDRSSERMGRPCVRGKFIFVNGEKFYVRGVTYGTFRPDNQGNFFPDRKVVAADFARMASSGINSVRTYTLPPEWLLDLAQRCGLHVLIGLPWEQHVTFLDEKKRVRSIAERVRAGVRSTAAHPAVLCYAIGNEIPASIVRWYGCRPIERFLRRLCEAAKEAAPDSLVTYVNYPTTEYLELGFTDLLCFNLYLESEALLKAYLAHLQNLAGDRPLILTEIGMDSCRNGEDRQAALVEAQIRTVFEEGAAGVFVFSWTDDWYRGGMDIRDWGFGLTSRDRSRKAALWAVQAAFANVPLAESIAWPRISVVVCTCNGARTIAECLEHLQKLDYPNYEVIVVDDGSSDQTAAIAQRFKVRLISSENRGLATARNLGMQAATGEIIAYIDDDAYPDRHWLTYLASTFLSTNHVGVGGPNIPPPGDDGIADSVANAPGGPVHILFLDHVAEHIPGCNCAFRRCCLEAIGGFDPQFRVAGDDVDVCWRLQQMGWTIGFNSGAVVWHHRRNTITGYWKQQKGYGKAEAMLEKKWPGKYNAVGHIRWTGRVYGRWRLPRLAFQGGRVYHGMWGSAAFQSLYEPGPETWHSLFLMPEWYLVSVTLGLLSALGILWSPLLWALPLFGLSIGVPVAHVIKAVAEARFPGTAGWRLWYLRLLTALLSMIQPIARLSGRLTNGLTPWRIRAHEYAVPRPSSVALWSECWQASERWLESLESILKKQGRLVVRGGGFDRWDLEVRPGIFALSRIRMVIEEHGDGKQFVRMRSGPRLSAFGTGLSLALIALAARAASDGVWLVSLVLGTLALLAGARILLELANAEAGASHAFRTMASEIAASNGVARRKKMQREAHDEATEDGRIMTLPLTVRRQIARK